MYGRADATKGKRQPHRRATAFGVLRVLHYACVHPEELTTTAIAQHRLSEQDFEPFLIGGIEGLWELYDGILAEKPARSWEHQNVAMELGHQLRLQ